jgi:hypothetical protein
MLREEELNVKKFERWMVEDFFEGDMGVDFFVV